MIIFTKGNYYRCLNLPGLVELIKIEGESAHVRYRGMVIKVNSINLSKI
jgi:hypothetical protein